MPLLDSATFKGLYFDWTSTDSDFPTHAPLNMGAPTDGNGTGIKTLWYQTAENSVSNLQFAFNELKFTATTLADFGLVAYSDVINASVDEYIRFNDGAFYGTYLNTNTSGLTWQEYVNASSFRKGHDGSLYSPSGNIGVLAVNQPDNGSWFDDGTIHIEDQTGTYQNQKGDVLLAGTAKLAIPYGYTW
ncbi:hypothetical protein QTO01_13870 [Vibrio mytili]|uniref:hypothetical protein n=1 Tax=Vibrio mytili TaxID=50718 RepID=UPI002F3EF33C